MRYIKTGLILVLLIIIGCSRKSDRQLLDSASQKLRDNNAAGAIADYKLIIEDYPSSPSAVQALAVLGSLYTSRRDSSIDETASYYQAINYYSLLVKNFPADKEAPKAQFMIGFIYANQLQKTKEAREAYEKFIRDYPKHELVQAAKDELAIMGMPPEEILNRKNDAAGK